VRAGVPDGLLLLIQEMLAVDAGRRPPSAEAIVWQLRALQHQRASQAPGPLRVLVVDDDPAIAKLMSATASYACSEAVVETVGDGEAALRQLRANPPDLMLLDVHIPRVNGVEVCMYMRGAGIAPDCTVVAVSAGAQDEDRELLLRLGIQGFVVKGRNMRKQLVNLVQRAAQRKRPRT